MLIENVTKGISEFLFQEFTSSSAASSNPLATFFLATAVALFIALLGWGDQIRTPQKESKQLEKEFMEKHGIDWEDLRYIIRKGEKVTPGKKMMALTNLMKKRKLKTKGIAEHSDCLKELDIAKVNIEKINLSKYNLTVYLTILFFIFGIISIILNIFFGGLNIEYLFDFAFILIAIIIVILICRKILQANKEDEKFRGLIKKISDEV